MAFVILFFFFQNKKPSILIPPQDSLKMDLEQVKEEIVREEALLALRNGELASLEESERELKGK